MHVKCQKRTNLKSPHLFEIRQVVHCVYGAVRYMKRQWQRWQRWRRGSAQRNGERTWFWCLLFLLYTTHSEEKQIKQRRQKRISRWENDKRMKERTRAQDNILCWYYFSVDPHHTISFIFQRYFNLEINNDNDNHDVLVEFCRSFGFVPPHKLRLFKMIKSKSKSPSWKYQRHTHEPTNISFGVLHPLMPSLPTFIF